MVPPAPVRDLLATAVGTTSIRLDWTTPQSGSSGQISSYDLRFSTEPISDSTFDEASSPDALPAPITVGEPASFVFSGLNPSTHYFFEIRSKDEFNNRSSSGNLAESVTSAGADTVAPGAIQDLAATDSTGTSITLQWTTTGDDGSMGTATAIQLRSSPEPINEESWPLAIPVSSTLPIPGRPGSTQRVTINNLPIRQSFYYAMVVLDEADNRSPVTKSLRVGTKVLPTSFLVDGAGSGELVTIMDGVQRCLSGDTIFVAPGTYQEHVNFLGKSISLISVQGPGFTIIDGSHAAGPVVEMSGLSEPGALLEGFTVSGGTGLVEIPGAGSRGGGVYISGAPVTVRGNWITRNSASSFGGGVYSAGRNNLTEPPLTIEQNSFADNYCRNGGALAFGGVESIVRQNEFLRNQAQYDGGAIFINLGIRNSRLEQNLFMGNSAGDHGGGVVISDGGGGRLFLSDSFFIFNVADGSDTGDSGSGGGLYMSEGRGEISNNTFVGNEGGGETPCSGGGIALLTTRPDLLIRLNIFSQNLGCGLACRDQARGQLGNNLFWENSPLEAGTSTGQCPVEWLDSLMVADPLFCDPFRENYHLRPNSPAILGKEVMGAFKTPGCSAQSVRSVAALLRGVR